MKSVTPVLPAIENSQELEVRIGENQPQYETIHALILNRPARDVVSRWEFSDEEREAIAAGADLVFTQLTFGKPYNPVNFQVLRKDELPVQITVPAPEPKQAEIKPFEKPKVIGVVDNAVTTAMIRSMNKNNN